MSEVISSVIAIGLFILLGSLILIILGELFK